MKSEEEAGEPETREADDLDNDDEFMRDEDQSELEQIKPDAQIDSLTKIKEQDKEETAEENAEEDIQDSDAPKKEIKVEVLVTKPAT